MNRRGFVGIALAGLGGFFFPRKLEACLKTTGTGTGKWTVFYSNIGLKEKFPSFEYAARSAKFTVKYSDNCEVDIRPECVVILDPIGAAIDYHTVCRIAEEFDWWRPYCRSYLGLY